MTTNDARTSERLRALDDKTLCDAARVVDLVTTLVAVSSYLGDSMVLAIAHLRGAAEHHGPDDATAIKAICDALQPEVGTVLRAERATALRDLIDLSRELLCLGPRAERFRDAIGRIHALFPEVQP